MVWLCDFDFSYYIEFSWISKIEKYQLDCIMLYCAILRNEREFLDVPRVFLNVLSEFLSKLSEP